VKTHTNRENVVHSLNSGFPQNNWTKLISRGLHIATLISLGLIVASSSLIGNSGAAAAQQALIKTGYVLLMVILASIIAFLFYCLSHQSSMDKNDVTVREIPSDPRVEDGRKVLTTCDQNIKLALVASPFVVLRGVYGLLYAFNSNDFFNSTWSPLWGSAVALALMALLPEFVALVIYTYLGFRRIFVIRDRSKTRLGNEGEPMV
jgi:hypothetical protein